MPVIRAIQSVSDVPAADWDRLANPAPDRHNPFVSHAFLESLEASGSVGPRTGWLPRHLVLEDGGRVAGAMPLYLKSHSQGEYVFDHGWAEAYQRAGGRYYPKLQSAVPFTPVPGPRLLVGDGTDADARELALARGAIEVASNAGVSSLHVTFLDEAAARRLAAAGYMLRSGRQFHWFNRGYATFDDFLASLASRKRKTVRKERLEALANGISIQLVRGAEITEAHWDASFDFYMDTGGRKWGRPYLNRRFFSELGQRMADRCLLVLARRDGRHIAGALNLIGGDCLYGRYWGAIEQHPCLHFEVCYYRAIEWAIANRMPRVEAGAQGDHKLARGYEPVATFSSHWIADPGLARAVGRFLAEERAHIEEERQMLAEFLPFRKVVAAEDA